MVEMALELLRQEQQVQLDEERKAAMVSNLLVVLCADREAQPVVNTGTLVPIAPGAIARRSCCGLDPRAAGRARSAGRATTCAA